MIALVGVAPYLLLVAAAFIKFAVVLSILRRALAKSAVPPAAVVTLVSLGMAFLVTAPIGEAVWPELEKPTPNFKGVTAPVRDFLSKHTPQVEKQSFLELSQKLHGKAPVQSTDLSVLGPAFVTAELKGAFQSGFLLFLPFLVIELLVASILLALGMNNISSELVSLPFKLLLFVVVDGWHLLLHGLVLGYT